MAAVIPPTDLEGRPQPRSLVAHALRPRLPRGRYVELPGRGRTFVREIDGPPGAPTVVLLHGWFASGALNWFQVFEALGEHYNVIAPDHRGHARGLRTRSRFRLADCADDVAALIATLGIDRPVVVGYSMGGPIAQLLWHRHPESVGALVFAATAAGFVPGARERIVFNSLMATAVGTTRLGQAAAHVPIIPARVRPILACTTAVGTVPNWAAREFRRHDWRMVLEAGHALGTYHARWIGDIDVPTSIVLTTEDNSVAPHLQDRMAAAITGATVFELRDGHVACAKPTFTPPLLAAVDDVVGRAHPLATSPTR